MKKAIVQIIALGSAPKVLAQWGALGANTELTMQHCGDKYDFQNRLEPNQQAQIEEREDREARRFGYWIYISDRAEAQLDRTDARIKSQVENRSKQAQRLKKAYK